MAMELRPGVSIDRYTLVEPLGQGGQGAVWKVVDPLKNVLWALKLFDLAELPQTAAERARREAQTVTLLRHPAIVPCHALFEIPADGILGLVFELVSGQPLSNLIADPRLTAAHRLAILEQLSTAVLYVHGRGVVHRDLKPSNILIADSFWSAPRALGGVRLIDFGIAKALHNRRPLTVQGGIIGTKRYMAPELLLPHRFPGASEGVSRDIFALGVLAWELVLGEHPTGLPLDAPGSAYADAYEAALQGRRPWPPGDRSSPAAAPFRAYLELDPQKRPGSMAMPSESLQSGSRSSPPSRHSDPVALAATTALHPRPSDPPRAPAPVWSQARTAASAPPSVHSGYAGQGSSYASSAQTVAAPSSRGAMRRAPVVWLGALVAVITLATLAVSLVLRSSEPTSFAPPIPSPVPGGGLPVESQELPVLCCGDDVRCSSERPCVPGTCNARVPDRWWWLRLSGVASGSGSRFSEDMAKTHPSARVCVRRAGTTELETCAPLANMAATPTGDPSNRLRVRTSDLELGRLEIRLKDGNRELTSGISAANAKGILMSSLCKGLKLYVGPRETATTVVYAYLDDK
jgi:serine/threonine-protein kinase